MKGWLLDLGALGTDAINLSKYAVEVFKLTPVFYSQLLMFNNN